MKSLYIFFHVLVFQSTPSHKNRPAGTLLFQGLMPKNVLSSMPTLTTRAYKKMLDSIVAFLIVSLFLILPLPSPKCVSFLHQYCTKKDNTWVCTSDRIITILQTLQDHGCYSIKLSIKPCHTQICITHSAFNTPKYCACSHLFWSKLDYWHT